MKNKKLKNLRKEIKGGGIDEIYFLKKNNNNDYKFSAWKSAYNETELLELDESNLNKIKEFATPTLFTINNKSINIIKYDDYVDNLNFIVEELKRKNYIYKPINSLIKKSKNIIIKNIDDILYVIPYKEKKEQGDEIDEYEEQYVEIDDGLEEQGNRVDDGEEQGNRVDDGEEQGNRVDDGEEQGNRVDDGEEQGNRVDDGEENKLREKYDYMLSSMSNKYSDNKYYLKVDDDYYVTSNIKIKDRFTTIYKKENLSKDDKNIDNKNNELINLKKKLKQFNKVNINDINIKSSQNKEFSINDIEINDLGNLFLIGKEYRNIIPYIAKLYEGDNNIFLKYKYDLRMKDDINKLKGTDVEKYKIIYERYNNYSKNLDESLKKIKETLSEKSEINKKRKQEKEEEDLKNLGNLTLNFSSFATDLSINFTEYISNTILSSIKTMFATRWNDVITGFIIIIIIITLIFTATSKNKNKNNNKADYNPQNNVNNVKDTRDEGDGDIFTMLRNIPNSLNNSVNSITDTYKLIFDIFAQGERLSEDLASVMTPQLSNTVSREIYDNDGRSDNIYYYINGVKSHSTFQPKNLNFKNNKNEYIVNYKTENINNSDKFIINCDNITDNKIFNKNCEIKIYENDSQNETIYTDYDKIKIKE